MNYGRIVGVAVFAWVAYFTYGSLVHGILIARDYVPYPEGVQRSGEAARSHMPIALVSLLMAMTVFATLYDAKGCERAHGVGEGAPLGLLFGIFMAGAFAAINYGTINISGKLAVELVGSALVEWTLVGTVVGLIPGWRLRTDRRGAGD
jgi:hypothetical protein